MADIFGDRMKKYEAVSDIKLTERIPIILRIDGNSFSKFTKKEKFEKPFDPVFADAMNEAMLAALNYCSGAQIGYTQSDEITILLLNDMTNDTQAFLGNRLEKLCSLVAGKVTARFNRVLGEAKGKYFEEVFDCRVFLVPEREVNNAFLWRQMDAFKNSVSGICYHGLSEKYGRKTAQKMMHGKGNAAQQELCFQELGINVNDYPTKYKRGVCAKRVTTQTPIEEIIGVEKAKALKKEGEIVERSKFELDYEIPLFNKEKDYIEELLTCNQVQTT